MSLASPLLKGQVAMPLPPAPHYLQSLEHGLPIGDQFIKRCKVEVLAEQPQSNKLVCRDLQDKDGIRFYSPLCGRGHKHTESEASLPLPGNPS